MNNEDQKTNQKTAAKKKEDSHVVQLGFLLFWILIFLGFLFYKQQKYPKLHAYGVKNWSIKCEKQERSYHLFSTNQSLGGKHTKSISSRELRFLDKKGDSLYRTSLFDPLVFEKESVWQFRYNKNIGFLKKDRQKEVLKGDEKLFQIAKDFKSMNLVLNNHKQITLPCNKVKKPTKSYNKSSKK